MQGKVLFVVITGYTQQYLAQVPQYPHCQLKVPFSDTLERKCVCVCVGGGGGENLSLANPMWRVRIRLLTGTSVMLRLIRCKLWMDLNPSQHTELFLYELLPRHGVNTTRMTTTIYNTFIASKKTIKCS